LDVKKSITRFHGRSARWLSTDVSSHSWPSAQLGSEFGMKLRVSILTSSQDSRPNISDIQSDNLKVVQGSNSSGKPDDILSLKARSRYDINRHRLCTCGVLHRSRHPPRIRLSVGRCQKGHAHILQLYSTRIHGIGFQRHIKPQASHPFRFHWALKDS